MEHTPADSSRRSHSPEEGTAEVRKRRRIALSCYDCRRRKLRCDREYPACGRCRKGGHADTCSYDTRAEPPPTRESHVLHTESDDDRAPILSPTSLQTTNVTTARTPVAEHHRDRDTIELLSYQRRKIAELENRLAQLEGNAQQPSNSPTRPGNNNGGSPAPQNEILWPTQAFAWSRRPLIKNEDEDETMLLRGHGFKTQFFGATNITANMVTHFPGLRSFMQNAFSKYPTMVQGRAEAKALRERWKKHKQYALSLPQPDMATLIPEREVVDQLVKLYFDTLETTYRILHRAAFWEEYSLFWIDPSKRRAEFVAVVLAVMSTVITMSFTQATTYCADIPVQLETAINWIDACEAWLSQQSSKHTHISAYQVRCLLVLARYVNSLKWKQLWLDSRGLVTFGMAAGLHRDPRWLIKETTIFDQEMRRRLWFTMVELELQGSIYRGMPSATQGLYCDTAAPLNVNDDDISHSGRKAIPTPWPIQEYTSTSFLHVSARSLGLRIRINSAINNPTSPLTYDEAMTYSHQIVQELEKIPSWAGREEARLARAMLDIQLRQYLILLHDPFARKAASDTRYSYSRNACFDAAASILDQHNDMMSSTNRTTLLMLRSDAARSALAIIQTTFMSTLSQDHRFFQNHKTAIEDLMEKALYMVEEKTIRTGAGIGHIWHISAAYNLLLSKVAPEGAEIRLKESVERLSRLHQRIHQSQEPLPSLPESAPTTTTGGNAVLPDTNTNYASASEIPDGSLTFGAALPGTDGPMLNFADPQTWALDDLWTFGPIEM